LAPALAAGFQLILMRVRLGLGLAAGGGAASPSVLASRSVNTQKEKSF